MFERAVIAFLGTLCIGLVPFAPNLLRTRIGTLRWLGFSTIAGWHERNFETLAVVVRILLGLVGIIMLFVAVRMG